MTTNAEAPGMQVLISNLSLPIPLIVAGSASAHERYIQDIGADGLELAPTRVGHFMGRLLYRAMMLEETNALPVPLEYRDIKFRQLGYDIREDWSKEDRIFKATVRGLHSSFRHEVGDDGILARTVPTWQESLGHMRRIQRQITGKLPAVLYPVFEDGQVVYDDKNAPFAERTFQPKASEWRDMGLAEDASTGDIKAVMDQRGFTGVTYDVFHCRVGEDGGKGFRQPLALAERLAAAGLVSAVHLSVNRLDIARRSPLTKPTLRARETFIRSAAEAERTPEGAMLSVIIREWQRSGTNGTVVLEDGPLRLPGAKRDHTAMIATARELIANA